MVVGHQSYSETLMSEVFSLCLYIAGNAKEDSAVSGGNSPESVWSSAHALCGQVVEHALPCAGPHGGHACLQTSGNAARRNFTGLAKTHNRLLRNIMPNSLNNILNNLIN